MTGNELLLSIYEWASANAGLILTGVVVLPLVGAGAAWIGKGGKTDSDGRLIASLLVGSGITVFVLEIVLLIFSRSILKQDVLEANFLLLIAPILYLGITPISPPSDPARRPVQGPPARSKFLAAKPSWKSGLESYAHGQ
jgi:hypothetical protein